MTSGSDQAYGSSASSLSTGKDVPTSAITPLHYCLVLFLLPLLAIPLLIQLGRSNFFLHHGASVWVQSNDAVFDMHDRECDVLIYGDSTAMTGIDPDLVEGRTGFRTCNIAVTNAVLAVTDDLTLNAFLAHNGKPRVLLVQLSPDHFRPENHAWQKTIYAEGLLEFLRHTDPSSGRHMLLTHPQESVAFAGYAAGFTAWYAIKDIWFHTTHLRPEEDTVVVRNGFFTPPTPPRTQCTPAASVVGPATPHEIAFSRGIVSGYEQGFENKAGVVLVNVAPIPSCDQNLAVYSSELRGITSNTLLPLPIGLFNDGRHYTALGSQIVSALVARELNMIATHNPSIDDRVTPNRPMATLRRVHLRSHHGTHHDGRTRMIQSVNMSTLQPLTASFPLSGKPHQL
ncbi:MAG: hypothetical protein ACRYFU_18675 [Janthinobacterium lividum]